MVQEAVATGDPDLVQTVLEWRDYQRYSSRVGGVPELLQKLKEVRKFPIIAEVERSKKDFFVLKIYTYLVKY